jgi:hypothetical protein
MKSRRQATRASPCWRDDRGRVTSAGHRRSGPIVMTPERRAGSLPRRAPTPRLAPSAQPDRGGAGARQPPEEGP